MSRAGEVFSIAAENRPVPGCTISQLESSGSGYHIYHFSMAAGTDISPESYAYPKLWLVADGDMDILLPGETKALRTGEGYITPADVPVGVRANTDSVFTEITLRKESNMTNAIKDGEVFTLKELVPYQEGKIVNMDIIRDEKLKFVVMSFAPGTGLPEHAAPGGALIFALDGEGIIGYEEKEYVLHTGENFKFAKNGAHYVKAEKPFKIGLLLTLE